MRLVSYGVLAQVSPILQPPGTLVRTVTCNSNPKETYALYLPSAYSPDRKWPIIYVFDPGGGGQIAAAVIQVAAERFGYIIAASNNSRNGPMGGSAEAASAVWQDTQQRFSVDGQRRYVAGMSGGARVATSLAISCGDCVAGVIANAAGFPPATAPSRNIKFAYFAAVGNADFNYAEFAQLRLRFDEAGARYHIRVFEGQHGWAPADVWTEALNWMDLQAMAAGTLARDPARIASGRDEALASARAFEARNDLLAAYRGYAAIVRDFRDLADVGVAKARVAELEKNKALKRAEKQETSDIEQQARIEEAPSAAMVKIPSGAVDAAEFTDLRSNIADMKRQAGGQDRRMLVVRRALSGLVVQAFESGQLSMEQKNYRDALLYFELAATGSENPAWARYQRARVYAMTSDKKNMLAELRLYLAAGVCDTSALDAPEFQAYRDQPEFEKLRQDCKAKATASTAQ
jgi:dienelactone hydrolase